MYDGRNQNLTVFGKSGHIISHKGYPNRYPNYCDTTVTLSGFKAAKITLQFSNFHLESRRAVRKTCGDFLNVDKYGAYCGDELNGQTHHYELVNSSFSLRFRTNIVDRQVGFDIKYTGWC